jgi:putative copper export protein
MITPTLDSIRIALHLLAVAVWVGGQIVLAGVVPALRHSTPTALPVIARSFARVAWPSMVIIVFTGVWGLTEINVGDRSSNYHATFGIKMLFVAAAIIATLIHSAGQTKLAKALGGAIGLLASIFAMYLGTLMAHVS